MLSESYIKYQFRELLVAPPADPVSAYERFTVARRYAPLAMTCGDSFTVHHRDPTKREFCSHGVVTGVVAA